MAKTQKINPVRGTQDMYGEAEERFAHVVATFERVRRLYNFKGLQLPVIEPTAVFARSLGETTDVVSKEMYTFEDRGGDSVTLRPEFTAGIARAYLSNGWQQHAPMKVTAHGPLFRYERPQKGRYRQFHQIDAEIIGAAEPQADVELLVMADQLLKELGIGDGITLQLNTLGDADSREAWRAGLIAYFNDYRDALSPDSVERLEVNPLRILDSKDHDDRGIAHDAPRIDEFLSSEAQEFFTAVTEGLDAAGVKWNRDHKLVRGLDYYRHTAFEFVPDAGSAQAGKLGSQSTVLGGGRYDGLIENLGGPHTPAVGWAAGIERLAMLVDSCWLEPDVITACIVPESDELVGLATGIISYLRRWKHRCELISQGSTKKRFDRAVKMKPLMVIVLDRQILKKGQIANLRIKQLEQNASDLTRELIADLGVYLDRRFAAVDRLRFGSDVELFTERNL